MASGDPIFTSDELGLALRYAVAAAASGQGRRAPEAVAEAGPVKSGVEAQQQDAGEQSGGKGSKRKQKKQAATAAAASAAADQHVFSKLELRVGLLERVWVHESADKLFCEEIRTGDGPDDVRPVASGLRAHYTLEQMQGRRVIVICNLKPRNMQGFKSHGMVLAAKNADDTTVELVAPPEGAQVGERVFVDGIEGDPVSAAQVTKKKVWEAIAPDLRTNDQREATYQGRPLMTSAGPCTSNTLTDAQIS